MSLRATQLGWRRCLPLFGNIFLGFAAWLAEILVNTRRAWRGDSFPFFDGCLDRGLEHVLNSSAACELPWLYLSSELPMVIQ